MTRFEKGKLERLQDIVIAGRLMTAIVFSLCVLALFVHMSFYVTKNMGTSSMWEYSAGGFFILMMLTACVGAIVAVFWKVNEV